MKAPPIPPRDREPISSAPRYLPGKLPELHYLSSAPSYVVLNILVAALLVIGVLILLASLALWIAILAGFLLGRSSFPHLIAGAVSLALVMFVAIPMLIAGELLFLLLNIESNTRQTKELLFYRLMNP